MNQPPDSDPLDSRIMIPHEVAAWLAVSTTHLNRRAKAGDIPSSRLGGGERRYWRPLLLSQLFSQKQAAMEPPPDDPEVITLEELALRLRLTAQTLSRRIEDGSIPASRIGNQYRIYWPAIRARLETGQDFPATRPAAADQQ